MDLYFLDQEFLPFDEILAKAKTKHVGLDDYWLAQALHRIEKIEKLPTMLKKVDITSLRSFFTLHARRLMGS